MAIITASLPGYALRNTPRQEEGDVETVSPDIGLYRHCLQMSIILRSQCDVTFLGFLQSPELTPKRFSWHVATQSPETQDVIGVNNMASGNQIERKPEVWRCARDRPQSSQFVGLGFFWRYTGK